MTGKTGMGDSGNLSWSARAALKKIEHRPISDNRREPVHRRIAKLSQFAIVLLTIVAWFSISNHCAFGALESASQTAAALSAHCHEKQSPSKHNDEDDAPCCKTLRATVASPAKVLGVSSQFFVPLPAWSIIESLSNEAHPHRTPLELDTGPPAALSFTESVLQRSILAHAPPLLS